MISIVRTTTLNALRADSTALETTRQELAAAKSEAATATDSAIRAENVAEQQLRQLAQAHADRIQAERERDQALETARQEAQAQLEEIRAEVDQIRRDAADTETGETMRAALAYRMFQRLYADARAQGLTPKPPVVQAEDHGDQVDGPGPDGEPAVSSGTPA
jgi:cell division septum initiation protein DivIVA